MRAARRLADAAARRVDRRPASRARPSRRSRAARARAPGRRLRARRAARAPRPRASRARACAERRAAATRASATSARSWSASRRRRAGWRRLLRARWSTRSCSSSGDIDVFVVSGDGGERPRARPAPPGAARRHRAYALAALVVRRPRACCLGDARHASTSSTWPWCTCWGSCSSPRASAAGPRCWPRCSSVAAFDFFFVPPHLTFAVSDTQYLVTFAVMLVVGLLVSTLAARVREQPPSSRASASARTAGALRARAASSAGPRTPREIAAVGARHVAELLRSAAVRAAAGRGRPRARAGGGDRRRPSRATRASARSRSGPSTTAGRGRRHRHAAGSAARSTCRCVGGDGAVGVLGHRSRTRACGRCAPDQRDLLETLARQIAGPLERARLAESASARAARRRERAAAQHALELGLARPAHAARRDHRRCERPAGRAAPLGAALRQELARDDARGGASASTAWSATCST